MSNIPTNIMMMLIMIFRQVRQGLNLKVMLCHNINSNATLTIIRICINRKGPRIPEGKSLTQTLTTIGMGGLLLIPKVIGVVVEESPIIERVRQNLTFPLQFPVAVN